MLFSWLELGGLGGCEYQNMWICEYAEEYQWWKRDGKSQEDRMLFLDGGVLKFKVLDVEED